jgi:hypothetical protein
LARPSAPSPTIASTTALTSRTLPAVSMRRGYPARVAFNRRGSPSIPCPSRESSDGGACLPSRYSCRRFCRPPADRGAKESDDCARGAAADARSHRAHVVRRRGEVGPRVMTGHSTIEDVQVERPAPGTAVVVFSRRHDRATVKSKSSLTRWCATCGSSGCGGYVKTAARRLWFLD